MPHHSRGGSSSRSKSPPWDNDDSLAVKPSNSLLPLSTSNGSLGGSSSKRQSARAWQIWDTPWGTKLFVGLIIFFYMGTGGGMVSQEHILFWTGVYKFNYPMFTAAAQLICTQVLLIFFSYLTRLLAPVLNFLQFGFAIAPPDPPAYQKVQGWGWGSRGGVLEFEWKTGKKFIFVSAVFSLKVLISNFAFAYGQFPVYQMSRILTIPFALFFATYLQSQTLPTTILSSALSVAFGLFMTSLRHVRFAPEGLIAGIFSSFFTALYPFTLLQAYNIMVENLNTGPTSPGGSLTYEDHQRAFWRLLYYINTFSLMFIVPLSIITGAWHEVYRTCYFLDAGFFWFMLGLSGLIGTLCFVFMLGMVRLTSPLDAIVATGPRAASTTALLSYFRMQVYSWVGFIMTWVSAWWYFKGRREMLRWEKEDRSRDRTLYEMH
ncbi:hypothetical protein H072_6456 [Dactylellina haptotyla CBS 200.50]|uniref:GDP-mannose transporter n=1 Tax=Dactylellina haptotyla (strain CBS 200.50) TaxID=1284197 RepID=S8A9T6_DACHA|nr:hypothetical protein H072_6456 [Dactylellina haptotyla CBS 200.50]